MKNQYSRRNFLKLSTMASAFALSPAVPFLSVQDKWYLKKGKKQNILILGAGVAGMSAAIELIKLGHEVKIIEAQTRAGGRIKTLRSPLAEGLYADLGAARIPENHDWTMKYIQQYGLKLELFNPPQGKYIDLIKGKKINYTIDHPADLKDYPVNLTEEEFSKGMMGIWNDSLKELMENTGDPKSLDWPPSSIAKYDQYSFKELIEKMGYSKSYSDAVNIGWETEKGMDMSVIELVREIQLSGLATRYKIIGGNDLLPAKMAEELANHIRYGVRVLDIQQNENEAIVYISQGNERSSLIADWVICSFPLPVIRKMDFVKTLSYEKKMAIYEMSYWNLSRSILQVNDRYWKKEGYNGFARTDQPSEIWDPNYESKNKRGLIAAYFKNDDSKIMLDWSNKERLNFAANHINEVFPGLHEHLEGGFIKNWGEDPWALGAHSIGTRGQMTTLLPHLMKPEGRIYFAGEHASAYHGWIQGAIESGNRAAKEINSLE